MPFIVEDGTVIVGATSLASVAFAETYLQDRNRLTENNWLSSPTNVKQAKLIAASDYLQQAFGSRWRGFLRYERILFARATLSFSDIPVDGETVTIAGNVLTFRNAPTDSQTEVLIESTVTDTIHSLVTTINGSDVLKEIATGSASFGDTMVLEALRRGTAGNAITVSTGSPVAAWSSATLLGGSDEGFPQSLPWPRTGVYNRYGYAVQGVPPHVKAATVEYAVRAFTGPLLPDPVIDPSGRAVTGTRSRVGPIEQETTYADGSDVSAIVRPYPAADKLLRDFLVPYGGTFR